MKNFDDLPPDRRADDAPPPPKPARRHREPRDAAAVRAAWSLRRRHATHARSGSALPARSLDLLAVTGYGAWIGGVLLWLAAQ